MIVISQDCDLLWDWTARQQVPFDEFAPSLIPHLLLCDLYEEGQLRGSQEIKSDIWRRIRANQDERYHHLSAATVGESSLNLPDLYIDYKKIYGLPTANLYMGIGALSIARLAVMPPIYLHDFIHRFFAFQSRVAVPE